MTAQRGSPGWQVLCLPWGVQLGYQGEGSLAESSRPQMHLLLPVGLWASPAWDVCGRLLL